MSEEQNQVESRGQKVPMLVLGVGDTCMSFWPEEPVGEDQWAGGPSHILIGRGAPDHRLQQLAQRYGHSVEQLQVFRDGPAP
jgi:hypothetical protein